MTQQLDENIGTFDEGDLLLESGQTIKNFFITYATHGRLNEQKTNAILVDTAIGANHRRLDFLIGPGKALDTDRFFVITTNAIGNGLTRSPSNSADQPGMSFPRFSIRDMVESQRRLVVEKFGLSKLLAIVGVSMGGMQALQWAVSHPKMMDAVIPIVPLAKTPSWTKALLELMRQQIMTDPKWSGGDYAEPPEAGMRLWAGTMALITRTPEFVQNTVPVDSDATQWLRKAQDDTWKNIGAVDWLYQSWAYADHDLGTSPGFSGDHLKALASIEARTLVLAGVGDLLNPESQAIEIAKSISGAQFASILPNWPAGHFSAAGKTEPEVQFLNQEIGDFLLKLVSETST